MIDLNKIRKVSILAAVSLSLLISLFVFPKITKADEYRGTFQDCRVIPRDAQLGQVLTVQVTTHDDIKLDALVLVKKPSGDQIAVAAIRDQNPTTLRSVSIRTANLRDTGTYGLQVIQRNNRGWCTIDNAFSLNPASANSCKISISPTSNLFSDTPIQYTVQNFSGPPGQYRIFVIANIAADNHSYPTSSEYDISLPTNNTVTWPLGPGSHGTFYAELRDASNHPVSPPCISSNFSVTQTTSITPGQPGENPCAPDTCNTALGNIPTDITGLATKVLSIAIGLAGGIALILLVFGSIRVLTSSGDQQRLAGGRDTIIAAIAGLLFLIFSVLILKAIGVAIGISLT